VILLRYYDGLPPRVIAERLRVPVKTVKSRLARGLEQLRARLVADLGRERGHDTLARSLAPLFIAGVSVVSSKAKLALAAAALVALLAAADPFGWRSRPAAREQPHTAEAQSETAPRRQLEAPADGPQRVELAAESPATRASPADAFRSVLRGTVVDAQRRSVAAARVELLRHGFSRAASAPNEPLDATTSDERGEFEFSVAPHRAFDLSATSPAGARGCESEKYAGERVVLRIQPPSTLRGCVTSQADGAPVAEALVTILLGGAPLLRSSITVRTDLEGRYVAAGLEGDIAAVTVRSALGVAPASFPRSGAEVALRRGGEVTRDFVIAVAGLIHGRVVDARTRAPIADAGLDILAPDNVAFTTRSNADGDWRAPIAARNCVFRITARARGYGAATLALTIHENDVEQEIALAPGRRARGHVLTPDGAPLAGASVRATARAAAALGEQCDSVTTSSASDGTFELVDLRRELTHFLIVEHDGFATILRLFPDEQSVDDKIELGDLAMQRGSTLAGKVLWQGDACGGTPITLRGLDADWRRLRPDAPDDLRELADLTDWCELPIDMRVATCDSNGLYHFTDVAPGEYKVEAGFGRDSPQARATVAIARADIVAWQDLILRSGDSIEGIVVDRAGTPVDRRQIHVISAAGERSRDAAYTDASGRFKVTGLATGDYALEVDSCDFPFHSDSRPNLAPRVVRDVAAGTRDLRIELSEGRRLAIRVLEPDGSRALHVQLRVVVPGLDPSLTTTWVIADFANAATDVTPMLVPAGVAVSVEARRARVDPNGRPLWPLASQPPDFARAEVNPENGELTIVLPPPRR
jgi:protocatechuate 3,4-dioxygenase beta subunit